MDKLALIIVGVFMLAGMHIAFNTRTNLSESGTRLAEDQYEILARNAAIAGLEHAKQLLSEEFKDYTDYEGTNDGVDYVINATVNGNQAIVETVGSHTLDDGEVVDYHVRSEFRRRMVLPPEAPPQMRYAVISDEDLDLSGSIDGDVFIDGNTDNELNANMHTNGILTLRGNAASVHGFGTFYIAAAPSVETMTDNFTPNNNPSGWSTVYKTTEEVEIDHVYPATIASNFELDPNVTFVETIGDTTLSGTYMGGTRMKPLVWHVRGNLTAGTGNTTVNGYVMLLVDGNVDVRGNVRVGDNSEYTDGELVGDESSLALYSTGGVRLRGTSEVWGQIYSESGVQFDTGNPKVYGSVTTKGSVDFRGQVDIFYRKASPGLTRPFQPDLFMLDRIAYSEW